MMRVLSALCLSVMMMVGGCASRPDPKPADVAPSVEPHGHIDGQPVFVFHLRNARGMQASVSNYGGALLSLRVPDRDGRHDDVVRGYDEVAAYTQDRSYFGTLIGRFANRIAGGAFTLDGVRHQLARNEGDNAIHGGVRGFNKVVWQAAPFAAKGAQGVTLRHTSADGDEGYPGSLQVTVRYRLDDADQLHIDYEATTSRPTVINLTNHSYFNLEGLASDDITGHVMMINADAFTPVDAALIPTGEIAPVAGTPFDFRTPTAIGARLAADDAQLAVGKGYDHNWVLNRKGGEPLPLACRVMAPASGRVMEVFTSEPGLQFYSGNFLDGSVRGKGQRAYPHRSAFVLETQHFPDSPNQPGFPSTVLRPGETYRHTTILRFSAAPAR